MMHELIGSAAQCTGWMAVGFGGHLLWDLLLAGVLGGAVFSAGFKFGHRCKHTPDSDDNP